ncbi:MAG: hypothetical protein M3Y27_27805 [Acidobacteriota bacterium]|nr:hypothetical protein [Acidobacteriota bacterium]
MDADTKIGGGSGRFPETRISAIALAQSPDERERRQAHGAIIEAYWKPVYKYLRLRRNLNNESAKDLTQGFFALAIEKRFFDTYDPGKGTFRTYLRTCVDAFVSNEQKRAGRMKRGGGVALLSLDFKSAEGEILHYDVARNATVDEFFHQEWVRSVFGLAIQDLQTVCAARGKDLAFHLFQRYDLAEQDRRPTYAELAQEFGITTVTLTNYMAAARREFRKAVLNKIRELTVDEREFRLEARAVLGIEV